MVWAMPLPGSFGDFFPDGDYTGWREELKNYFNVQMPKEEQPIYGSPELTPIDRARKYASFAITNFISENGKKWPEMPPFRPVLPHEAPKLFETIKSYSSLGSFIKLTDRILAVDEALKSLIESFDANIHQFFPIEISMPRKQVYPKRYWVIKISQYLDSFSAQQSKPGVWEEEGLGYYGALRDNKECISGLAFSKAAIGKAHLWRERHLKSPEVLLSDELQAAIANANLRIPKHYRAKEF